MYSEKTTKKYLSEVEKLRAEVPKFFTFKELSTILEVSEPTLSSFFKGRIIRFDLLEQVGALIGYDFWFEITKDFKK